MLTRVRVIDTPEKDIVLAVFEEDGVLRNVRVRDPELKAAIQLPPVTGVKAAIDAEPAVGAEELLVLDASTKPIEPPPLDPKIVAAHDAVFAKAEAAIASASLQAENEETERATVAAADAAARAEWDAGAAERAPRAAQKMADAQRTVDEALTAKITAVVTALGVVPK